MTMQFRNEDSEILESILKEQWDDELKIAARIPRAPSLLRTFYRTYRQKFLPKILWICLETVMKISQAILAGFLMNFLAETASDHPPPLSQGLWFSAGIAFCTFINTITHHQFFFHMAHAALLMRVSVTGLLYQKILKLHVSSFIKTPPGQVINLISNDVRKFEGFCIFAPFLFTGPFEVLLVIVCMWQLIGPFCLVGYTLMFLTLPIQRYFSRRFVALSRKASEFGDSRVSIMKEIINGIDILKMFTWEKHYAKAISTQRDSEVDQFSQSYQLRALTFVMYISSPLLIQFATFSAYAYAGNEVTSVKVFTSLSLFYLNLKTILLFVPGAIASTSEAVVAANRIENFLMLKEHAVFTTKLDLLQVSPLMPKELSGHHFSLHDYEAMPKRQNYDHQKVLVLFDHVSTSWGFEGDAGHSETIKLDTSKQQLNNPVFQLRDISLSVSRGELVIVVGAVGSGKSTLLHTLLSELLPSSGSVNIHGTVAYCSQQSWIQSGTVLSNILLGRPYNSELLHMAITSSCLDQDILHWPLGLDTEIGERGITLSGGQKARLSLARAVYDDADLYVLDDPLSAVDPKVANALFSLCIRDQLLQRNKGVLLVTHQTQFLPYADELVLLSEGRIVVKGSFDEIIASPEGAALCSTQHESTSSASLESTVTNPISAPPLSAKDTSNKTALRVVSNEAESKASVKMLINSEDNSTGKVALSDYWSFLTTNGVWRFALFALFIASAVAGMSLTNWHLAAWVRALSDAQNSHTFCGNASVCYQAYIYIGLLVFTVVALLIAISYAYSYLLLLSNSMHLKMVQGILRSPLNFFQANPSGRVLNRFSNDLGVMDSQLPLSFTEFIYYFIDCCASICIIAIVNPWVLISVGPILLVLHAVRKHYLISQREVKRIESMSRSPVQSHLVSTVYGLIIVRAYEVQAQFMATHHRLADENTKAFFAWLVCARWLGFRVDLIASLFNGVIAFAAVIVAHKIDPVFASLSLVYGLRLMGLFQWSIRLSTEVETMMTSVERTLFYGKLPAEAPLTVEDIPNSVITRVSKGNFYYSSLIMLFMSMLCFCFS
jgi:ATP-binding cassette subfamily C (CFTR/MRP) protein 4